MSAQIVVCQGEPYVARMIACRLMRADFAVHTARDCETAGDIIERLRPQLLIVDLQYPTVELLCRIRSDEAFADLPIIGLTSVAGHPATMALMQQQLNLFAVLTKPFSLRRLVQLARKAVQQSAELLSVV